MTFKSPGTPGHRLRSMSGAAEHLGVSTRTGHAIDQVGSYRRIPNRAADPDRPAGSGGLSPRAKDQVNLSRNGRNCHEYIA